MILVLCLLVSLSAGMGANTAVGAASLTFNAAIDNINKHPKVVALAQAKSALEFQSDIVSAWKDPELQFSSGQVKAPHTNFKISIMQAIPITSKHKHFKNSVQASSAAVRYRMLDMQRQLQRQLWQVLIALRKFAQTEKILQGNRDWILKALAVSKRLYANGKIEQRALLDIELRRAELDSDLLAIAHNIEEQRALLAYICNAVNVTIKAIPWEILAQASDNGYDYRQLSLQAQVEQASAAVRAESLARIPDLKLSSSYAQMDGMQMIGVMLSVPVPISKKHRAKLNKARAELEQAKLKLVDYHRLKISKLNQVAQLQDKVIGKLQILRNDMLQAASNSKHLAFVSYKLAGATYSELLAAELKLQSIMIERINLQATLALQQLQYKYLKGEKLHD